MTLVGWSVLFPLRRLFDDHFLFLLAPAPLYPFRHIALSCEPLTLLFFPNSPQQTCDYDPLSRVAGIHSTAMSAISVWPQFFADSMYLLFQARPIQGSRSTSLTFSPDASRSFLSFAGVFPERGVCCFLKPF